MFQAFLITILFQQILGEQQQFFNISEQTPIGSIIGYLNGTSSDGVSANFYIVFPDNTGEAEKVSKLLN